MFAVVVCECLLWWCVSVCCGGVSAYCGGMRVHAVVVWECMLWWCECML